VFKEFYRTLENGEKDKNYYVNESVGLAAGLLINAIRDSGYHSLTYTPVSMNFLKDIFARPEGESPVMILAVGKKDDRYSLPAIERKSIDGIAEFYSQRIPRRRGV